MTGVLESFRAVFMVVIDTWVKSIMTFSRFIFFSIV